MTDLPKIALSVRQPWAHAIIYLGKPIENRDWLNAPKYRGPISLHAGQGMTQDEYEDAADFMWNLGVLRPPPAELKRGGIIGSVEIVDVVRQSDSPWFVGPLGFVLRNAKPCDFIPCTGALSFFEWKPSNAQGPLAPAKWMMPKVGSLL